MCFRNAIRLYTESVGKTFCPLNTEMLGKKSEESKKHREWQFFNQNSYKIDDLLCFFIIAIVYVCRVDTKYLITFSKKKNHLAIYVSFNG